MIKYTCDRCKKDYNPSEMTDVTIKSTDYELCASCQKDARAFITGKEDEPKSADEFYQIVVQLPISQGLDEFDQGDFDSLTEAIATAISKEGYGINNLTVGRIDVLHDYSEPWYRILKEEEV